MSEPLKSLMGETIYNRFTIDYYHLAYGDSCQQGFGIMLPYQVKPIVNWYYDNKQTMDQYIMDHPREQLTIIWLEFKEMFINKDYLIDMTKITKSLDGIGYESGNDLYRIWKQYIFLNKGQFRAYSQMG